MLKDEYVYNEYLHNHELTLSTNTVTIWIHMVTLGILSKLVKEILII